MNKLRLFKHKHENFYLTTFEEAGYDPVIIQTVSIDPSDNLFPSKLPLPLQRDPIRRLQKAPIRKAYGYPICWCKLNFEWYPYLPAVVSFKYPIFRGMSTDPPLIHDRLGYKLSDEDISRWKNVEHVMTMAVLALQAGRTFPPEHEQPPLPSEYGYTRGHSQEKFAKKSVMKSLNAFQQLLAYCSYSLAGRHWSRSTQAILSSRLESTFSIVYAQLDSNMSSVHILAKDLFWTLSEMHTTRNFTGTVVRWTDGCDLATLNIMRSHDVPVYVAWPPPFMNGITNPYKSMPQSYYLNSWTPTQVNFSRQTPHPPEPVDDPSNHSLPSTAKYQTTYDDPMDYIKLRLRDIPDELTCSRNKQAMVDRGRSAQEFRSMGSAKFYKFEQTTVVDKRTGEENACWIRELLTKHYAQEVFQSCDNSELWYERCFLPFPFFNNHVGSTVFAMSGIFANCSP